MTEKQTIRLLLVVVLVLGAIAMFSVQQQTTAQSDFTGTRYNYVEISFSEPVGFSSSVSNGYFRNGEAVTPENPNATVNGVFNSLGSDGWELVTNLNNQFFIFKRPAQQ
jgi:hypothetical protein